MATTIFKEEPISMPSKTLAVGMISAAMVPLFLAESVKWHERNMTFISPKENEQLIIGQIINITTLNYGLSSLFHLRTSLLYLISDDDMQIATTSLQTLPEWSFLGDVGRGWLGTPTGSRGNYEFIVPEVPVGDYRIKYESGWTIAKDWAEFHAVSPKFKIAKPNKI